MNVNISGFVRVRELIIVTIDCGNLINTVMDLTGINPTVTWFKNGISLSNGSEANVVISQDRRRCIVSQTLLAVGGQLGTSGNYTCRACGGDGTAACLSDVSPLIVCGK